MTNKVTEIWIPKTTWPETGKPIFARGDNTWGEYIARGVIKMVGSKKDGRVKVPRFFIWNPKRNDYESDSETWRCEIRDWRYQDE